MIEVTNIDVWGFEHAIRGMRNPLNSWAKSDSKEVKVILNTDPCYTEDRYEIGSNDLDLMQRLYKASLVGDNHAHRKFLRQIMVSMDVNAPRYLWTEIDTYKIGTVANSCSTMHRIHSKEFDVNDFSHEHVEDLTGDDYNMAYQKLLDDIKYLNYFRDRYLETKEKKYWWQLIEKLPQSYNQKRTLTLIYEVALTMINQRKDHKLDEWRIFVNEYLMGLPYLAEITGLKEEAK